MSRIDSEPPTKSSVSCCATTELTTLLIRRQISQAQIALASAYVNLPLPNTGLMVGEVEMAEPKPCG
ncbi:hypothetical protein [Mycobacterium lepromatosis]|uniref:hypothetical protein n=1 Tax=Mycobacterium lepromatosis TaxID=480418 RepID=UPI001F2C397D|nr:hypothetical protein [Mycobacterium lepromatosis]